MASRRDFYSNYGATDSEVVPSNNSRKITSLCDNITSSLYDINRRVKNLKSVVESIGTQNDSQQLRDQIQLWQNEVDEKKKSCLDDVNTLNTLARTANKQQKLQISKITSHCKDAMTAYCNIQQEVLQKLASNLIPPSDPFGGFNDESTLLSQEQIQIQKNLDFENQLLQERQQSVKQIEKDIVQLNRIMKELGALAHEHSEAIDTIESRIESAYDDVQVANQELTSAVQYQNKSRKRKVFLIAILAIVLIVLIGVIIWSAKS